MGLFSSITKTLLGNRSAKRQRQKLNAGEEMAIGEARNAGQQIRNLYAPFLQGGQQAVGDLSNPAAFTAAPGYQWRRAEGERDIGNLFAARGGAFSGNALRAVSEFNQNLASNEYGNWYDQTMQRARLGFGAAAGSANAYDDEASRVAGSRRIQAGNSAQEVAAKYGNYGDLAGEALSWAKKYTGW